jgi:flagellar assembly protein FliH
LSDLGFAPLAFPVIADATTRGLAERADVRGHAAGYAAGLRAAEAETAALRDRLLADHAAQTHALEQATAARLRAMDAAIAAFTARLLPVLDDAQDAMISAAMDVAEAVVGYEIRASRPAVPATGAGLEAAPASGAVATLERALASVDREVLVAVRLSPEDVDALVGLDTEADVVVLADPSLQPGDAVVELPDGILDARIGAALDRARTALGVPRA